MADGELPSGRASGEGSQRRRQASGQRPSARSRTTATGSVRQRGEARSVGAGARVQRPAAQRSDRTYAGSSERPARRTPSTARQDASARSRRSAQQGTDRRSSSSATRERQERGASQPSGGLAAAGGAFLGFFESLRERVPAFQAFSAPVLAALTVLLVVVLFGVGCAVVRGGASHTSTAESSSAASEEAQSSQAVQTAGSGVNPDEPADLVWRDEDFAVDPAKNTWSNNDNGRKVVYLTIDDGPSKLTEQFLDLLDQYNVKATFFVTGHDPDYYGMIREAYNRGHTIGLHTMTHEYSTVYASEQAYYADLDAVAQVVKDQIGYVPCFVRFPGGSSNTQAVEQSNDKNIMKKLTSGLLSRGYQYYDWSLSTGDGADYTTKQIIAQTTESAEPGYDPTSDTNIVILCHDSATKQSTLEALPTIIEFYQNKGYTFEAIDRSTWICHHAIYEVEDEQQSSDSQNADGTNADGTTEDSTEEYNEYNEYTEDTTGDYQYEEYEEPYVEETYYEETYEA